MNLFQTSPELDTVKDKQSETKIIRNLLGKETAETRYHKDMDQQETPLVGGQMTSITRKDDKVYRDASFWTPAVHQLLDYLEKRGFDNAPHALGFDDKGREILTYISGEAGYFDQTKTVPKNLWSDKVLIESAQLLRKYHDATVGLKPSSDAKWQTVCGGPLERDVICHNDFAPYNCIFDGDHLKAMIDFDTAGPGPRLYDIAYAVYSFVPLFTDEKCHKVGLDKAPDRTRKLQIFCDAYGRGYCDGVVDMIIERLQDLRQMVLDKAAAGDSRFQHKIDEGHVNEYEADIAMITSMHDELESSLQDSNS